MNPQPSIQPRQLLVSPAEDAGNLETASSELPAASNRGEAATNVTSVSEQDFFTSAAQVYLQHECDDARAMLFDGGKDIQIKLCRQLAAAHEAAVTLLQRGMGECNTVEAARIVNAASRLMSVFQQGVLALRNVQAGSDQRITLQQVNVSGGNAVVGANVMTGAASASATRWEDEK